MDVKRAADLYARGWTLRQISAQLGLTETRVSDQLRRAGVTVRRAGPPGHPPSTQQILELRDRGLTWNEVAKQVGMTVSGAWSRYRKARPPKPQRLGRWQQVLTDALDQNVAIGVRASVADHLGRTPSRAELNAARRAAHSLAALGLARVLRVAGSDAEADAGDRHYLVLAKPNVIMNDIRLRGLAVGCGLLVIDEAHCVSDWGFDFRPDYQRLTRTLLGLAPGTPVLATTATANRRVTADVARQLGEDTVTLCGLLARSSLRLAVVPHLSPLERYAWVAEALRSLPGSGIVYVLTVAETERVAGFLLEQGLEVAAYSGQTTNRVALEDRLRDNTIKALVATSALGMGFDKPDLAFWIHLGSPASPVAYYQQVGRAGRALEDAQAILVPAESDERIWDYFATSGIPDKQQVERILDALGDSVQSLAGLEVATGIRRGRLEALLKILVVDDAVRRESAVGPGRAGPGTSTSKSGTRCGPYARPRRA